MMSDVVVIQRLLLTSLLAGCVGFERERHGRAAGLRTHILVGLGACLAMQTAEYLMRSLAGTVAIDPTQMGSQVISGIGFLGAGTILRFRASVRGLTTAASLWAAAGIGLAVGAGFLIPAGAATLIVLVALFGLGRVEPLIRKDWYRVLVVETRGSGEDLARLRRLLADFDIQIRDFEIGRTERQDVSRVELNVKLPSPRDEDRILADVLRLEGMQRAHWM